MMKPRLKMAMAAAEMLYSAKQREPQKQSLSGHFILSGGLVSSTARILISHLTEAHPPFLLLPSLVLWKSEARCQQNGVTCVFPGCETARFPEAKASKGGRTPCVGDVPRDKPS